MSKEKAVPVARISLLDVAPEFDLPVTINVRGNEDKVTLKCKTLGKLEWAAIRDEVFDEAQARVDARAKASEEGSLRMSDVVRDSMAADASIVMKFAISWDVSEPLNVENLAKLENMAGGSLRSIVEAYETAIYQGRLGN